VNIPREEFLVKHRLLANQYKMADILSAFLDEMDHGLNGRQSSLAMIPSYITLPSKVPKNEKIIVLDAGGTNFRTALIRFDANSAPHIDYFANNPMPGIEKEISGDEFFEQIAEFIKPVLKESKRLGFCFSYPATIDRQRDGTLLYWTKEVKVADVVGQKILFNLSRKLNKMGLACPESMLILNDTVASLLAGVTATTFSTDYEYIGLILGTGTNTAYIEKNGNIKKEKDLNDSDYMAINCESANFDRIDRGDIDIAFDNTTALPGKYALEKMISGGYLGSLCYKILITAAAEGVLSPHAAEKLHRLSSLSAPFLNTILSDSLDQHESFAGCSAQDLDSIKAIVSAVVERASLLTAINLSAPMVKLARESGKKRFCVSADGSVYYKLHSFRARAEKHLDAIVKPYGVEYQIVKIDEAPLIGTAVAGLA
jgi:hexokinase